MVRHGLGVALLAAAALLPAPARANCARPVTYDLGADGSGTVTVQPLDFEQRGCGDDAMLRQDVSTGDTVQLAPHCGTPADPELGAPYLDECVPAGRYRYGFATAYACHPASCGTYRWEELTVTAPPDGCTLSTGNPGPSAVAPAAWGSAQAPRLICAYEGEAEGSGCGTAPGASGAVLLLDAAALALGWALLRRRRARRT